MTNEDILVPDFSERVCNLTSEEKIAIEKTLEENHKRDCQELWQKEEEKWIKQLMDIIKSMENSNDRI